MSKEKSDQPEKKMYSGASFGFNPKSKIQNLKSPIRCLTAFGILYILLCLVTAAARADTVLLRSAESVRSVKVVAFKDGRLEVLASRTGQRRTIDYDEIALIRVDGQAELNDAEKNRLTHRNGEAIAGFQKALPHGGSSASSWLSLWVKVRLMHLYAAAGEIDRMGESCIDLARRIPEWSIRVSPTRDAIRATDRQLDTLAHKLTQAREESKSDKTREALLKFYQRLGRNQPPPPVKAVAAIDLDEKAAMKNDQPGPWLDAWAEHRIKIGKADSVLRVTEKLFSTAQRRNLPAVFHWQGRARLAAGEFDAAALDFLHVIIEFPADEYTPASLFYAAQAANANGRPEYARSLWRELIDKFSNANDYTVIQLVEKARDLSHEKGARKP